MKIVMKMIETVNANARIAIRAKKLHGSFSVIRYTQSRKFLRAAAGAGATV